MIEKLIQNRELMELLIAALKVIFIAGAVLGSVPFMVWLERRLLGLIQHRTGPNRVGPFGLLQTIADGVKLLFKEDVHAYSVNPILHRLAPLIMVVPAIMVISIIPIGPAVRIGQYTIFLSITDLDIGILFYLAITSISVYGIVLAGWSSNSKYSLLGGFRSSAQMLSYEIALGLSLVGVLLIAGTFQLRALIEQQSGWFWHWNLFKQPVGALIFLVAGFAESNRLPFDLPEGESELGGGFHTEYSSMKFALFFMSEYMNMFTFSAIMTTLFLGGFHAPFPSPFAELTIANAAWGLAWFSLKVLLLICFMIFIRGTWPRLRYDQLMDLGWKVMFPLALLNLVASSGVMVFAPPRQAVGEPLGAAVILALIVTGAAQIVLIDRVMSARRKRVLSHAG